MNKFLDDLGNKAKSLFGKAQTAVEVGCDRFNLSLEIQAQQHALKELFTELGRLTYHGNADLAGVRPKQEILADITAASEKLQALEEAYAELNDAKEDPGIDLAEEPEESAASCFCHKCGTPQPEGNDFCHKCGTKLNK